MLKFPQHIQQIINTLEENGYEAYIVGGSVRDALLGNTPDDFDITTSCPPEKVIQLFEKTIPTGIKHGTVTVIINSVPTEVTTYRIDGDYSDNRSPDSVVFTSNLSVDLSRRDFTVNALAYNEKCGIIDLFNGRNDLNKKIIRTVGNPQSRFCEDALRILRAIRFSCTLKFSIEASTYIAAINNAELLLNISGERIFAELTKALMGENLQALEDFINRGGLKFLNIANAHNFKKINNLPKILHLRIFAFFKHSDADFTLISKKLKFNNKLKQQIEKLYYIDNHFKFTDKQHIKKILKFTDIEIFSDYLEYYSGVLNNNQKIVKQTLLEIVENNEPFKVSMLNIDGEDIKKYGFIGEKIGCILKEMLNKCVENPTLNQKHILEEIIKTEYM